MNSFIVPPSPNWYRVNILACAPDNTIVYGTKTELVVINSNPTDNHLHVNFINHAHGQKVQSVDINSQWGTPNKWAISSGEDNLVKLWNISTLSKISGHEAHKDQTDKLVGARFLTEDRVLSVSDGGDMFIWHPSTKEYTKLKNFFLTKVNITCFSPCPHASYITAFGMKNGLIVVANLKKNGSVLYKLRGHTSEIVSFSWCPAPINIFPSKPNNYLRGTIKQQNDHGFQSNCKQLMESNETNLVEVSKEDNTIQENIIHENVNKVSFKPKKPNPWVNLKFEDDDDNEINSIIESEENNVRQMDNFLQECDALKKKIKDFSVDCVDVAAQNFSEIGKRIDLLTKSDDSSYNHSSIIEKSKDNDDEINPIIESQENKVREMDNFLQECDALKENLKDFSVDVASQNVSETGKRIGLITESDDSIDKHSSIIKKSNLSVNSSVGVTVIDERNLKNAEPSSDISDVLEHIENGATSLPNEELQENQNSDLEISITQQKLENGSCSLINATESNSLDPVCTVPINEKSTELHQTAVLALQSDNHIENQSSEISITQQKLENGNCSLNYATESNSLDAVCTVPINEKSTELHQTAVLALQSDNDVENQNSDVEISITQQKLENGNCSVNNATEGNSLNTLCTVPIDEKTTELHQTASSDESIIRFDKMEKIEDDNIGQEQSEGRSQENEGNAESIKKNITCKTMLSTSVEEEPRKEYLLASSGRDSTVYIWRAGTDGRMQCFFKLPEKKNPKNKKSKDTTTLNPLIWITPKTLLTSTMNGNLLKFSLPTPLNSKKQYTIVHNEHGTVIFTIAAHVPVLTAEDWLSEDDIRIWTFGHDMHLLNTKLDTKAEHLTSLETFSALILVMAQSPLDPNRIALGLSNGSVKIMNANDTQGKSFSTLTYAPKIYGRISGLAWHPTNELVLAFCTEEGTIGLLNTNTPNKATWFKQSFSNKVHKIQWGPSFQNKNNIGLYATGEGNLMRFDPDDTNKAPQNVLADGTLAFTFAWKLDKSLLLLVTSDGKVIIFNSDLSIKATYYQQKKISCVAWHPESECASQESTDKTYWVAAALDHALYILDFGELSVKSGVLDIQDVTKTVLEVHQSNIQCLAWSPFNADWLVTAGDDGMAHVWNVSKKEVLASYYSPTFDPLRSIIWSPIQEDIVICSSTNASLISWKLSDYPAPLSQEIMNNYKMHVKNLKKIKAIKEEAVGKVVKHAKRPYNPILPSMNAGSTNTVGEKVKLLQELLDWKENKSSVKTNGVPSIKHLFGSREDVLKLLTFNEVSHTDRGKHEGASMVSFWKGDLQKTIQETIDQRRVTPLLISMAPSISLSLWQKACETYAIQLEEEMDSDPIKIATYYLVCQNIEKAINCLCDREMFKEALALAKCKLPDDNVFEEEILQKWAKFSAQCGNMENAAQCYIVLGKYEEAVKVLFRRNEPEILNFALELAKITDNTELIKAIEFRCIAFSKAEKIEEGESSLAIKEDHFGDEEKITEDAIPSNSEEYPIDNTCNTTDSPKYKDDSDFPFESKESEDSSTNRDDEDIPTESRDHKAVSEVEVSKPEEVKDVNV